MSIASLLHAAKRETDVYETIIGDALTAAGIRWADFDTDEYDNSIEIYETYSDSFSPEQVEAVWSLGFSRVWFHTTRRSYSENKETTYFRS